jgi:hypothetical protein
MIACCWDPLAGLAEGGGLIMVAAVSRDQSL